jgi:aryl-alcohol dehydrogenase-like predicted oxidoreductase
MAREEKLTVLAWSPLRNGVLTGKYTAKAGKKKAEGGRLNHEQMKGFISPDDIHHPAVAAVAAVAKAHGISSAQVALAWLRAQTVPVIPIIGARKLEQFEDNLRCLAVKLTQDDLERLDKASQVPLGFPYSMYRAEMVKNFVFGGLRNRIRT